MLFQPKIILKQILISITGMDTRTSKHSSVIAIFHVSQTLVWFYVGEKGFLMVWLRANLRSIPMWQI